MSSEVLRTSATWIIIHRKRPFVKNFFRFFYKNFIGRFSSLFSGKPAKCQIFFSSSAISSGVNV